jgi:hypothetical protein
MKCTGGSGARSGGSGGKISEDGVTLSMVVVGLGGRGSGGSYLQHFRGHV